MRAYRPYIQVFATRLLFIWMGLFCSLVHEAFTGKTGDNSLDGTILGGGILLLVIIATIWLIQRDSAAHPDTSAFLYRAQNSEARRHARTSILLYAGVFLLFLYQSLVAHFALAFTFPVAALLIGSMAAKSFHLYRLNSAARHGVTLELYPPLHDQFAVVPNTAPADSSQAAPTPAPLAVMTRDRILVLVLVALMMILRFLAS